MTGRRAALAAALTLTAPLMLAGCSSGPKGPQLTISGAFVPQPVTADLAGGYLTVTNSGDAADELTSVTSGLSDDITLNQAVDEMRQVTSFKVPAHGTLD